MSRIQSRRTVSLARPLYDAARERAESEGRTLSQYVADALRAAGVEAPETVHVTPEEAKRAVRGKRVRLGQVLSGWVRR